MVTMGVTELPLHPREEPPENPEYPEMPESLEMTAYLELLADLALLDLLAFPAEEAKAESPASPDLTDNLVLPESSPM